MDIDDKSDETESATYEMDNMLGNEIHLKK